MKLLFAALLLSVVPLSHAQENVSKANGDVRVPTGKTVGDVEGTNGNVVLEDSVHAKRVESVNGTITIGRNAKVETIETVNGAIRLDAGTRASSISTVNGGVHLAEDVQINGAVSTVNGGIRLARGASAGSTLTTTNGPINLDHASVAGDLHTTSGDVEVGAGSTVKGGIIVEKAQSSWLSTPRTPRIYIGPGAVVSGPLKFEREVRLYVDAQAKVGPITGVKPIKLSTAQPAAERDAGK
jgi:hypothetical protein